jgi:hypothetical protein
MKARIEEKTAEIVKPEIAPPRNKMQERFRKKLMQTQKFDCPVLNRDGGGSGIVNFKYEKGASHKRKVV